MVCYLSGSAKFSQVFNAWGGKTFFCAVHKYLFRIKKRQPNFVKAARIIWYDISLFREFDVSMATTL